MQVDHVKDGNEDGTAATGRIRLAETLETSVDLRDRSSLNVAWAA
jgi:hypothetical protein